MAIPTTAQLFATVTDVVRNKFPVTATYSGQGYTVGKAMQTTMRDYDSDGAIVDVEFVIIFVKSELDGNSHDPQPNEKVTIDGTEYRIAARTTDPMGASVKLGMENPYK